MVKFSLILSLQHAIRISHKNDCSCSVTGSAQTIGCSEENLDPTLIKIEGFCKNGYMLNNILLDLQSVKQTHVGCRSDGDKQQLFTTNSIIGDQFKISKDRLCLKESTVNDRKKKLVQLLGDTFDDNKFPKKQNVRVIARATASQRDAKTGKHKETVEWDTLVVAVSEFFEKSQFQNMQIMPIENEGRFALKAIKTLIEKCEQEGEICGTMAGFASQKKLISMEQGGRSMQIWNDDPKVFGNKYEIPNGQEIEDLFLRWDINQREYDEFYGDHTGLYSNLGNGEIINQLADNSSCLIPTEEKPGPKFNKAECRDELKKLDIIRSKSDKSGKLPTLMAGGLYVAFGCFFHPAKMIGIQNSIKEIKDVKTLVTKALQNENGKCPDNRAKAQNDFEAMECMQLLVLEWVLDKMLSNSTNTDVFKIVFVEKIGEDDISWTVGLAETMKEKVKQENEADIVVLDIGSSSTKIFRTSKNKNETTWSQMEKLITLKGGDLISMTACFSDCE